MGICYKCKKEITLTEEEVRCDNCGEILRYW
jgi:DNA-directed RNA polymerase subunit RPC12/RpoP